MPAPSFQSGVTVRTPATHIQCTALGSVLSYLAGLANQATPEGRLSAATLTQAASSCEAAIGLPADVWPQPSSSAWADPGTRCSLMKLLSYSVRQMLAAVIAAEASSLKPWTDVFMVLFRSVVTGIFGMGVRKSFASSSAVAAEVVRLLARTDLVQCLIRLAMARLPTPEAAEMIRRETGGVVQQAATAAQDLRLWMGLVTPVRALQDVTWLCTSRTVLADHQDVRAAMEQLRETFVLSGALEHVARAVVLVARRASPEGGGITAADGRQDNPRGDDFAALRDSNVALTVDNTRVVLHNTLFGILVSSFQGDRPLRVWANAVLSGPCTQYFLLLHTVSQLCAVDGGPDYGLPSGARLPAIALDTGSLRMSVSTMIRAFRWWAMNSRTRPCSDRALRAVCERAIAAANASVAADGAAAAAGTGDSARVQFSPPEGAMAMATAALNCVLALTRDGAAGDFRGLWAPVVQTAHAALRVRPSTELLLGGLTPLQLMLAMPLPPLSGMLADGGSLPAQPGPDLAAALVAGYVPALERTFRKETRQHELMPVLQAISSLVGQPLGLASLMAYGECTEVAALLATSAKVLAAGSNAIGGELTDVMTMLLDAVTAVSIWDGSGSGPADRLWWRRHGGLSGGAVAAPALESGLSTRSAVCSAAVRNNATADVVGRDASSSGGATSSGGSGKGSQVPLPPLHQLSLLATFAATRWLPEINEGISESSPEGAERTACMTGLTCIPMLLHAYLHCTQGRLVTGSGGGGSAAHGPSGSAAAGAASSSGGDAPGTAIRDGDDLRAAAASWEQLLLAELDLPGLVESAVQCVYRAGKNRFSWDDNFIALMDSLTMGLLHLTIAFPRQGRALLRTKLSSATGGGRKVFLVDWMRKTLLAGACSDDESVRHFLELAPAVAAGKEPSAGDLARLRSGQGRAGGAARVGALLPPPCVVAALLQLRLCSNPGCTDLQGDSEAGRKGGGGASYCCRACQLAHSRAGRKAGAGGAAAKARGRSGA